VSESPNDLQPSVDEVLQAEHPDDVSQAVPVRVVGADVPVRTQDLPKKAGATRSQTVTATTWVRLLTADHRRAIARVISVGQNMLVAYNLASTQDDSRAALVPANTWLPSSAVTEIWVKSATGTTVVSYITEMWATGEGQA
jgi:hypothetical protein